MKTFILTFVFVIFFGAFQIAEAQTDLEVKVQVNRQKTVFNNDLTVRFISVLDDSRCPEGTNCIWAGNAKVQLKLRKKNGAWKTFELNTKLEKREIKFNGYTIKISDLTPAPAENVKLDKNKYTATFVVSKK